MFDINCVHAYVCNKYSDLLMSSCLTCKVEKAAGVEARKKFLLQEKSMMLMPAETRHGIRVTGTLYSILYRGVGSNFSGVRPISR